MERDAEKSKLQSEAADMLGGCRRLMATWSTGTGKSGIALEFIRRSPNHGPVLILVPERNNIPNWEAEFRKAGIPLWNVEIICYASLKNYAWTSWWLLVLDEAPHVNTERRTDVLAGMKADYVLALGAVISDEERVTLTRLFGCFTESHIDIGSAIDGGILPMPEVRVLHMEFDDTKRDYTYGGRKLTAKEIYDVIDAEVCTARDAYTFHPDSLAKIRMLRAGGVRKRFLGRYKEDVLRDICGRLSRDGRRFICFCSSVDQAERLGGELALTSRTAGQDVVLERFNSGGTNAIYVVGKLIEGQNLNRIECGVIGQLGGSARVTAQSIGRVLRSIAPVIYVPLIDGTKDEKFFDTVVSAVPKDCIRHYRLKNIS